MAARSQRRTLAVSLYEVSKDLRVVEQMLGHQSLTSTVRYLEHRDPAKLKPYLDSIHKPTPERDPVKTLCAWCGSTIEIRCNHCNAPTIAANVLGGTFGLYGDAAICLNGETAVVFTQAAIDRMEKTYGLCDRCAELPADERDAMIKIRRAKDREIPGPEALALTMQQIESANKHERQTRAHKLPHEKRGPTGVTRSATPRADNDTARKPKDK